MVKPKTKYEEDKQITLEESNTLSFEDSLKKIKKVLDKLDNLEEDEGGEPKEWLYLANLFCHVGGTS